MEHVRESMPDSTGGGDVFCCCGPSIWTDSEYLSPVPRLLCPFLPMSYSSRNTEESKNTDPPLYLSSLCFLVILPVAVTKWLRRSNFQEGGAYVGSQFEGIQSTMVVAVRGKPAPHIAPIAQKQSER